MKNLKNSTKQKINAFIDGELNAEERYEIEQLIGKNQAAEKFYNEMINTKKRINFDINIKASENFENELFIRIKNMPEKKNAFAFIGKIKDYITMQRLSYAVGTLLFLFFFGFALYRFGQNNAMQPSVKTDSDFNGEKIPEIFNTAPDLSMRGQPKGFSESKSIPEKEKVQDAPKVEPKSMRKRMTESRDVIAKSPETRNQKKARSLFDKYEKVNNGKQNVAVKDNFKKGVDMYRKGDYSKSRKHFLLVVQKAKSNSNHYRSALKYLQKMSGK